MVYDYSTRLKNALEHLENDDTITKESGKKDH
jgi:hypothetical protein